MDKEKIGYVHSDYLVDIEVGKKYHSSLVDEYFPLERYTTYTYHYDSGSQDDVKLNLCNLEVTASSLSQINNVDCIVYDIESNCDGFLNDILDIFLADKDLHRNTIVNCIVVKNNEVYLANFSSEKKPNISLLALMFSPSDRYISIDWIENTETNIEYSQGEQDIFDKKSNYEIVKGVYLNDDPPYGAIYRKKKTNFASYSFELKDELGANGEVVYEKGVGIYSIKIGYDARSEILLMKKANDNQEEMFYSTERKKRTQKKNANSFRSNEQYQSSGLAKNNQLNNENSRNGFEEKLGRWLCANKFISDGQVKPLLIKFEPLDKNFARDGVMVVIEDGCYFVFNYKIIGTRLKATFHKSDCGKELVDMNFQINKTLNTIEVTSYKGTGLRFKTI